MAVVSNVRIDLLGERVGTFADEIWQTGISVVASDAGGEFPGAIKQPLPTFDARAIGDTEDDATWNIYYAWEGTGGVFGKAQQKSLAAAALAFFNGFRSSVPAGSQLYGVRITANTPAQKVFAGSNYFYLETPVAGSSTASSQLPPQLCVAMSLRTGARGPGGRGRMYLPLTGGNVISSGSVTSANATAYAAGGKAFLEALHAAGVMPAIVNSGKQQYSAINRVSIGSLMDVQRRRRNNFVETYTTANLSYAP